MEATAARAAGRPGARLAEALRRPWSDRRTELLLGALACSLLALIAGMVVFVFANAWPSFSHNGLAGSVRAATSTSSSATSSTRPRTRTTTSTSCARGRCCAGTILTTAGRSSCGVAISLFAAIFIVEFAPPRLQQGAGAGGAPAGGRAVRDLRADRRARDRAVRRQPPDQRGPQGIGRVRRAAHRLEPDRGRA